MKQLSMAFSFVSGALVDKMFSKILHSSLSEHKRRNLHSVDSVCRSGPCNRKKTENQTRPDWRLQLHAFQTMQLDRFKLIATGFKGDRLQLVLQFFLFCFVYLSLFIIFRSESWHCRFDSLLFDSYLLRLQTIKTIVNSCRFKGSSSDEPRRVQVLDLYCLTRFESEGSRRGDVY